MHSAQCGEQGWEKTVGERRGEMGRAICTRDVCSTTVIQMFVNQHHHHFSLFFSCLFITCISSLFLFPSLLLLLLTAPYLSLPLSLSNMFLSFLYSLLLSGSSLTGPPTHGRAASGSHHSTLLQLLEGSPQAQHPITLSTPPLHVPAALGRSSSAPVTRAARLKHTKKDHGWFGRKLC